MSDTVRDAIATELALLVPIVRVPVAPYGRGVDLVCVDDLTPRLEETDPEGTEGIAQDIYHRLTTPRGTLPDPDDSDYGYDVRQLLSRPTDETSRQSAAEDIANELRKDDRLDDVQVGLTSPTFKSLRITIIVEPANPDLTAFTLILSVEADGSTLLELIAS